VADALQDRFDREGEMWRDPAEVVAQWQGLDDPELLVWTVSGSWWETLAATGVSLLVTREYEHLALHLAAEPEPRITYLRVPHPSGAALDAATSKIYLASTRNPNQIYELGAVAANLARADDTTLVPAGTTLMPRRTWYLPGCTYVHDLAMIGSVLHANAVGENCVISLRDGEARRVWWPASIEENGEPICDRNVIQLNSIAAGDSLETSFFSASGERAGRYRPGHPDYPVDRLGVVFSGATREPIVRGLTRPHSARLWNDRVLVDNSGYGELVAAAPPGYDVVARLPGWTRGLGVASDIAFVGTSRVLPRFRQYAPGLDADASRCGVHAVDLRTGSILGSIEFPTGNQIFAVEVLPGAPTAGFPFDARLRDGARERRLFYAFTPASGG
jgi:uncharacterized protein (TIGR03032 family)